MTSFQNWFDSSRKWTGEEAINLYLRAIPRDFGPLTSGVLGHYVNGPLPHTFSGGLHAVQVD